jgi:hypothetical protein
MRWWSPQFGRAAVGSNECVMAAMGVCQQRPTAASALTPIADATRRAGDCVGPAATIAGFVVSLMTAAIEPELSTTIAHLREVLATRPTNHSPA